MIFIDSNVPIYMVGAAHPNKDRAVAALQRPEAINAAFDSLDGIADDVLNFGMAEIRCARALLGSVDSISARDALHVAVMRKAGVSRILSFDDGFNSLPGIERLK